jgi:hypothetical protein
MPDNIPPPSKDLQKLRLKLAEEGHRRIKEGEVAHLPKDSKNENICIHGVCDVYRKMGFDFSPSKGSVKTDGKAGEGSSTIEYNPTFEQDAEKLGWNKVEVTDPKKLKQMVESGDVVQYYGPHGEGGKSRTYHSRMVLGKSKEGNIQYYDNYRMGQGESGMVESTDDRLIPDLDKGGKVYVYKPTEKIARQLSEKNPNIFESIPENSVKLEKLNSDVNEWGNIDTRANRQERIESIKKQKNLPDWSFSPSSFKKDKGTVDVKFANGKVKSILLEDYQKAQSDPEKFVGLIEKAYKS